MYQFNNLKLRLKINQYCQKNGFRNIFTNLKQLYCFDKNDDNGKPVKSMEEVRRLVITTDSVFVDGQTKTQPKDLLDYSPTIEELPPRTMKDSLNTAILSLSKGGALQNKYVSTDNNLRRGILMEDLDLFAVWTCMQHVYIPKLDKNLSLPYVFVTITVTEVEFTEHKSHCNYDVHLRGFVSWVGTSSMEVIAKIDQYDDSGERLPIAKAIFMIAARNNTNEKSLIVNPLIPESDKEKKIYAEALIRKNYRQEMAKKSLHVEIPTQEEQKILHDLFKLTISKEPKGFGASFLPKNCIWMDKSIQYTTLSTHPDHKNAQNTIFGGFLLRIALELSWCCAYMYSKRIPTILKISDVSFQKPVLVFSFLKMTAAVVYTHEDYITVMVILKIADYTKEHGLDEIQTTNVFHCIFKSFTTVPQVMPCTYHENLWYITGRRIFCHALKMKCDN